MLRTFRMCFAAVSRILVGIYYADLQVAMCDITKKLSGM